MKITKTKFKGLLVYNKQSYNDRRGFFRELYLQRHFKTKFPFDAMSFSKQKLLENIFQLFSQKIITDQFLFQLVLRMDFIL